MSVTTLSRRDTPPSSATAQHAVELRRSQTLDSICRTEIENHILQGKARFLAAAADELED